MLPSSPLPWCFMPPSHGTSILTGRRQWHMRRLLYFYPLTIMATFHRFLQISKMFAYLFSLFVSMIGSVRLISRYGILTESPRLQCYHCELEGKSVQPIVCIQSKKRRKVRQKYNKKIGTKILTTRVSFSTRM